MTDVAAGWYDDPERLDQWRYWDGANWTEHRSPKRVPPAAGSSGSAWQLIPDLFAMIARHWRELSFIVSPIIMFNMSGYAAALIGADRALSVSAEEFLDQVTSPGFDPTTDGRDAAWWDSIEFDVTAGVVAWWVVAAVGFLLATLGSLALVRFWIGAANDRPPRSALAWAGGLRRAPRAFGWALIYATLMLAAVTVLVLLAVVMPLTIPAFIVLILWTIPVVSMAAIVIIAGPPGTAPVRAAIHLVNGRWWRVTG